jgi:cyanophycin synthetase
MMKIAERQFYRGPNIWSKGSGLRVACTEVPHAKLDPAALEPFLAALVRTIPVAAESAWLASPDLLLAAESPIPALVLAVSEIVIRDFSIEPSLGTVLATSPGRAELFVPSDDEPLATIAVRFGAGAVNALADFTTTEPAEFRARILKGYKAVRAQARMSWLDQSTIAVVRGAVARGIPYSRLMNPGRFIQLGQGAQGHRIIETGIDSLSVVGSQIAADKFATGTLLARAGLPTPSTHVVNSVAAAMQVATKLGFPLVVKPRYGGKGSGVTVDIRNKEQLQRAFSVAAQYSKGVVVERFVEGEDHRVLVVGGRMIAAARRTPAHVIGDGAASVHELIERHNLDPRCGAIPFDRLTERIEIDEEVREWLAKAGLDLESVPDRGAQIRLRGPANISRGGSADDVTDIVHPDNRIALERAARLVGVNVNGIDFLTPDISRSWREVPAVILETNSLPGLRPHVLSNPDRDVIGPIVELMFPEGSDGRVPTIGITGSLGKTTTTVMTSAILANAGLCVGTVTTQGAWIGGEQVRGGDLAGGGVAEKLLQDPLVEAGVFELARGGLVKSGMVLDRLDVGVVLNVLDNHIGLNGAETREDLARIKRLVIENARKLAVLNADDPLCLAMRKHAGTKRIGLVSAHEGNSSALKHRDAGGLAAWIDANDDLVLFDKKAEIGRIALRELPDCWNGLFRPAAVNALFAACAAHGVETDFGVIASTLTGFRSDMRSNPGRNNYFENLPYRLFLSPCDGPESTREVVKLVRGIAIKGKRRLLITAAGDRPDGFIQEMARASAGAFDDYFCTDWIDLRGRAPGAVCEMLGSTLLEEGVDPAQIHVIQPCDEAIPAAYTGMGPDDQLLDTFGSTVGPNWFAPRSLKLAGEKLVPA